MAEQKTKLPDPIKIPSGSANPQANKSLPSSPAPAGLPNAQPNTGAPSVASPTPSPNTQTGTNMPSLPSNTTGKEIATKELLIAFGAVLAAAIIFFIIKNYVSKMLVSTYKKSPRSADMAGWFLFLVLLLATVAAALGILDSTRLFSLIYLIPLGVAILLSIIMFIVALRSKR